LEPFETSRTQKPSSQDQKRTQATGAAKTTVHGKTPSTNQRIVLSLLCVRFFRMSHIKV
jgi:hypothetical protein